MDNGLVFVDVMLIYRQHYQERYNKLCKNYILISCLLVFFGLR